MSDNFKRDNSENLLKKALLVLIEIPNESHRIFILHNSSLISFETAVEHLLLTALNSLSMAVLCFSVKASSSATLFSILCKVTERSSPNASPKMNSASNTMLKMKMFDF